MSSLKYEKVTVISHSPSKPIEVPQQEDTFNFDGSEFPILPTPTKSFTFFEQGDMAHENLILKLYDIGAFKFGEYKLKSGITSPIYIDLRVIISYPAVLKDVSKLVWEVCKENDVECDNICGVPYTALPIATVISVRNDVPMVIKRKESKDYGTKKMVEGVFDEGSEMWSICATQNQKASSLNSSKGRKSTNKSQSCLIIEDVVTTGSSVKETAECLREHGLEVDTAIVLLDRDQGGKGELVKHGIKLYSAFNLPQVLDALTNAGKLKISTANEVKNFLEENKVGKKKESEPLAVMCKPKPEENGVKIFKKEEQPQQEEEKFLMKYLPVNTYGQRAESCKNPISSRLLRIMEEKKTNLCLSADVESCEELLELAESVGPFICCIKTHVDTLSHFDMSVMVRLQTLAQEHNFVVFEDRKFADIGNTVKRQLAGGVYKIAEWADIINAHTLPGPGVLQGLQAGAAAADSKLGCLLVAQMSTKGNLLSELYTKATVDMADDFEDFVVGFISQSRVSSNPTHVHFTPGVKLVPDSDQLGQQYLTPGEVILNRGSDIIIVGRGILQSSNRVSAARSFRDAGWAAYLSRPKC